MHFGRGQGVDSMAAVLLVGGIGFLLVGLLAIGFGVPVKEFSFGNTLIVTGAIVACTGAIMVGLWIVVLELKDLVLELKNVVRRFSIGVPLEAHAGIPLSPASLSPTLGSQNSEGSDLLLRDEQPALDSADQAMPAAHMPSTPPWHEEAASRDGGSEEVVAPAAKPRRNLLFSSTSRKERERAQARAVGSSVDTGPIVPGPAHQVVPPPAESDEKPPSTFDDAWPRSERTRGANAPLPRRGSRVPSALNEAESDTAGASIARSEERPSVTVLKSGIVDGMAYSLYSDGSIEAQMPEGTMRFSSIDELRSYLDQRS